jgi:hypothetical protein
LGGCGRSGETEQRNKRKDSDGFGWAGEKDFIQHFETSGKF